MKVDSGNRDRLRHSALLLTVAAALILQGCAQSRGSAGTQSGASLNGLTIAMDSTAARVPSGGSITFDATLTNARGQLTNYELHGCGFASLELSVPLPIEPRGASWDGPEGRFKDLMLTRSFGPGGVPATNPLAVEALPSPCEPTDDFERTIGSGEQLRETLSWTADVVPGIQAAPGPIQFVLSANVDRQDEPPSYPPDYAGVKAAWVPRYLTISVAGQVEVTGTAPTVVSAGEAIDALLKDPTFSAWLHRQDEGTCLDANLVLDPTSRSTGPAWEIDLFCDRGVPRHFAIGWIDATTGDLLSVDICDDPCAR